MRDADIRKELLSYLRQHERGALLVEELVICQGKARVDVAAIGYHLHGYEIKSDHDTLRRLPRQLELYGHVFERITLVTTDTHLEEALALVPVWWGVLVVRSVGGALFISPHRPAAANEQVRVHELVKLLWHAEVEAVLAEIRPGFKGGKGRTRANLWKQLCQIVTARELSPYVRRAIRARKDWRTGSR